MTTKKNIVLREFVHRVLRETFPADPEEYQRVRDDTGKRGHSSMTYGEIPPPEELDRLLSLVGGSVGFRMQGIDSLAFGFAIKESPASGRMDSGRELYETLQALRSCPPNPVTERDIRDADSQDVMDTMDVPAEALAWARRYEDQDIQEHAVGLASTIMEHLGVEWV